MWRCKDTAEQRKKVFEKENFNKLNYGEHQMESKSKEKCCPEELAFLWKKIYMKCRKAPAPTWIKGRKVSRGANNIFLTNVKL